SDAGFVVVLLHHKRLAECDPRGSVLRIVLDGFAEMLHGVVKVSLSQGNAPLEILFRGLWLDSQLRGGDGGVWNQREGSKQAGLVGVGGLFTNLALRVIPGVNPIECVSDRLGNVTYVGKGGTGLRRLLRGHG